MEKKLINGYLIKEEKIVGEIRKYNPETNFGELLVYKNEAFGHLKGYVTENYKVMTEEQIKSNDKLDDDLLITKYVRWKIKNVLHLTDLYNKKFESRDNWENFCISLYREESNR